MKCHRGFYVRDVYGGDVCGDVYDDDVRDGLVWKVAIVLEGDRLCERGHENRLYFSHPKKVHEVSCIPMERNQSLRPMYCLLLIAQHV